MYEVHLGFHGRPLIQRGPMEGLHDFPRHKWAKITPRPLGLARAKALADSHESQAVVCEWETAGTVYNNGKPPALPIGWIL